MIKLKFRVIIQHVDSIAIDMKEMLNKEGIEVYDLREAGIENENDGKRIADVYVLCCKSSREVYRRFKNKHQYDEHKYEGFKTLVV